MFWSTVIRTIRKFKDENKDVYIQKETKIMRYVFRQRSKGMFLAFC